MLKPLGTQLRIKLVKVGGENKHIILKINNNIVHDTEKIANEFNKYFLSLFKDIAGN